MIMNYEDFEKRMAEEYPRYCGENSHFGGYAIGAGWYHVIERLIGNIDHYTKWKRNQRLYDLRKVRAKRQGRDAVIKLIVRKDRQPTEWDLEIVDAIMTKEIDVTPKVHWIVIDQIKEKFGGLRFYYHGGDDHIHGMTRMAEVWADTLCETCGNRGQRRDGGWVRTLCDEHEAEYQAKQKNMRDEDA